MQSPSEELKVSVRSLKELELHLEFFNLVFSNVLWGSKLLLLAATILCGSSAIRIIHTNPILGLLYMFMGMAGIIAYMGMFQFAYKVTEKVEQLMELMEFKSACVVNGVERKYWKRVLESFPRMGMNLGPFNRVEREAVPVFIDFSVNQIVSILIALQ